MGYAIAIKEASAKLLRQRMQQIEMLNAQIRGYVDALAMENDVPAGWRFDLEQMAFVEPTAAMDAQGVDDEEPDHA